MAEDLKVGGPKTDPKQDILYMAACERQRAYWVAKLPELSDEQIGTIMTTLTQAVNVITALDMADGIRSNVPYRSKLGVSLRMVLEMLTSPEDIVKDNA